MKAATLSDNLPGSRRRERWADLAALAILAALAVGVLWRANLTGKALVPGDLLLLMEPGRHHAAEFPEFQRVHNPVLDSLQQYYPWRQYAGERLRQGQFPLWNPYELCGTPFLANNLSAVLYPETWLHALMPTQRALGWASSLAFFTGGSLMYWFLRVLGLRWIACLLGAIAFMFNGFVVGWLTVPPCRSVPLWIPGILAACETFLRSRRPSLLALCALLVGLQFLAGQLHISLYVLITVAAYLLFRCVVLYREGERRFAVQAAVAAFAAVLAGGLLAAAQLLPVLELTRVSSRAAGMSYADLLANGLPLARLLTVFSPNLLGSPVDTNDWGDYLGRGYKAYMEGAFYVGVAPLLLAPIGFLRSRREALFWVCLAVVGVLLATGTHLNAPLYFLVPGYRSLAGISRAVLLVSVAISVLGAMGLSALLDTSAKDPGAAVRALSRSALEVGLLGLVAGGWAWMYTGGLEVQLPGLGQYTTHQVLRFVGFLSAAVVGSLIAVRSPKLGTTVVLVGLVLDLGLFVDRFTPSVNPAYLSIRSPVIERMKAAEPGSRILTLGRDALRRMSPNTAMIVGLRDVQGSESLEIGAYRRLLTAISSECYGFAQPDPGSPVVDLLGARFVYSGVPLEGVTGLRLLSDDEGYLYENTEVLPRAFAVSKQETVAPEAVSERVCSPDFRPREAAVVSSAAPFSRVAPPTGSVIVEEQYPEALSLGSSFRPGQVMVLADAYYPGWHAFQGAQELPVQRADGVLRAVQTRSDSSPVRFVYVPATFWVGGFLTLLAAAVLVGVAVASGTNRGCRQ
ncbi:hypothetical protein LLH03_06715 [bacterium]|nr:hypothetical protein [bacterium]